MTEKTKKAAVTGASGFLGQHLVRRLINEGFEVHALVDESEESPPLPRQLSKVVHADINNKSAIKNLFAGCGIVFNLASNFRSASSSPAVYTETNLEGTRTTLNAAIELGIDRFVQCSTIGVLGDVKQCPANEETEYNPGDIYEKTKMEAEKLCLQYIEEQKQIEICIIRPCLIYGPGDARLFSILRRIQKGSFFFLGRYETNIHSIYIDDLLDGFMKVAQSVQSPGEIVILGGPAYVSLRQYIATAAKALHADVPHLTLPYSLFYIFSVICEMVCVPLNVEPPLHRRAVRFFKTNRAFNTDKAKRILGFEAGVGLDEGMKRTVKWYQEQGLLTGHHAD